MPASLDSATAPAPPHLLVIDDQPEQLRDVSALLMQSFRLSHATDGQRGYQRALHARPDLILLDVQMPQADGFATCRLLQADPQTRAIPVIFLSAHAAAQERLEGLALGAVDYIAKPCLAAEVLLRVRVHLRARLSEATGAADAIGGGATNDANTTLHPDDVQVEAAMAFIRANIERLPSRAEIARKVGTYEKRLVGLFRERAGMTVSAFIAEERMALGQFMLRTTQLSVQDIATQTGFSNVGNFSTAFRLRFGATPLAYRRSLGHAPVLP